MMGDNHGVTKNESELSIQIAIIKIYKPLVISWLSGSSKCEYKTFSERVKGRSNLKRPRQQKDKIMFPSFKKKISIC